MSEWISIKDKLPKTNEAVIVCWPYCVTVGFLSQSDGLFYPNTPVPYNIPVTHWMPLPEPPKSITH